MTKKEYELVEYLRQEEEFSNNPILVDRST